MVGHDGVNGGVAEVTGSDSAPEQRPIIERTLLFGIQEKEKDLARATRKREEALAEVTTQTDLVEECEGDLTDLKQAYARETAGAVHVTEVETLALEVYVQGVMQAVELVPSARVRLLADRAAGKAGGVPAEYVEQGWSLRDKDGAVVGFEQTLADLDAPDREPFYLDPPEGSGS